MIERYRLADSRELQYKQPEGSFSNPNASVCIGTLNWLCDVSSGIEGAKVVPSRSPWPLASSSLLPHFALWTPPKAAAEAAPLAAIPRCATQQLIIFFSHAVNYPVSVHGLILPVWWLIRNMTSWSSTAAMEITQLVRLIEGVSFRCVCCSHVDGYGYGYGYGYGHGYG